MPQKVGLHQPLDSEQKNQFSSGVLEPVLTVLNWIKADGLRTHPAVLINGPQAFHGHIPDVTPPEQDLP